MYKYCIWSALKMKKWLWLRVFSYQATVGRFEGPLWKPFLDMADQMQKLFIIKALVTYLDEPRCAYIGLRIERRVDLTQPIRGLD
jgi:hypothetical protein